MTVAIKIAGAEGGCFFGRRRGRGMSVRQVAALQAASSAFIDIGTPPRPLTLPPLFGDAVSEVWLEIGFGAGEHLVWQGRNNPHVGFVGAEPYLNGVASAYATARETGLTGRLRIYPDDVTPLSDWLPASSVSKIFLLFPDPWTKNRHHTRRLFSPLFLPKLLRIMTRRAELRFATDIADYAAAARAIAEAEPGLVPRLDASGRNSLDCPDWPRTRYEGKALAAGRPSTFLSWVKRDDLP